MKCEHSPGDKIKDVITLTVSAILGGLLFSWPLAFAWNFTVAKWGWAPVIGFWEAFALKWVTVTLLSVPINQVHTYKENS